MQSNVCMGAMWSCVDDPTPDGDMTYVYATAAGGWHRVTYSAVQVPVKGVTVHVNAAQETGSGEVTVKLYDGALGPVATSTAYTLGTTYAQYTMDFPNVYFADASRIRTMQIFSAPQGRYTEVDIQITECTGAGGAPP